MKQIDALALVLAQQLSPETAHRLAIRTLKLRRNARAGAADDSVLATRVWGRDFPNPIGMAAGFDKDAEVIGQTLGLGFGFAEAGGVTPLPQPGNPRPRVFRLTEDKAVINRYGFNSLGLRVFRTRIAEFRRTDPRRRGIVGINLAKNRTAEDAAADYAANAGALAQYADFLTINVSSPNTPGLRALQDADTLRGIVRRVATAIDTASPSTRPALLVKVAPDLTDADIADVAAVAMGERNEAGARLVDGLIVGNTTLSRPDTLRSGRAAETGGLSGRPLLPLATRVLRDFSVALKGEIPLVGCGGVASGADAYAKIRAGASLVQLYTALVFEGPGLPQRIKRELAELLRRDGFASVAAAVGADLR